MKGHDVLDKYVFIYIFNMWQVSAVDIFVPFLQNIYSNEYILSMSDFFARTKFWHSSAFVIDAFYCYVGPDKL